MPMVACPFCGSVVQYLVDNLNHNEYITCPQCGYYGITSTAAHMAGFKPESPEEKVLFSGYLRNFSPKNQPILITSETFNNISTLIAPYRNMSVLEKLNKILFYLGENSKHIQDKVTLNLLKDFSLFFCKNNNELEALLSHLADKDLILYGRPATEADREKVPCILTIAGWTEFEKLSNINPSSKTVFIAMNFDKEYDELFEKAILPACAACEYEAIRVDKAHYNDKICDRIIADIKRSRFVIAEFTGQKNGVYFEAGYAQGIGLEVIKCCSKKEIEAGNLHFDIRQYNHVAWETIDDLRVQLIDRITATIKPLNPS